MRRGAATVRIKKRSDGERGKDEGSLFCGLRMTWKVVEEDGRMIPPGGLTRNFCGDEVWTLKATGCFEEIDLRAMVDRHLVPSENSMQISWSDTSTSFSIDEKMEKTTEY